VLTRRILRRSWYVADKYTRRNRAHRRPDQDFSPFLLSDAFDVQQITGLN